METVTDRELNRWTLSRQMLLERHGIDPVCAVERLAGMQAQHSPAPYIGLWSRLKEFQRSALEQAVMGDQILKATLMRGTLHLVSGREYAQYRHAMHSPNHVYSQMVRTMTARGIDIDAVRTFLIDSVRAAPLKRSELRLLARHMVPDDLPEWAAWSTVALSGDLINVPEDAQFGYFGGTRLRPAPDTSDVDPAEAKLQVVRSYFAAFGPATRADLAQWSGQNVSFFAEALDAITFDQFQAEDGRALLDLPDAPRPEGDVSIPVRFLPKWDNVLLAYARRERILPEAYRKMVIRKNGDVLPTFLVDGMVAGTWDAPLRGKAGMTLFPLGPIADDDRGAVEAEGAQLLAWLRPDVSRSEPRWVESL